MEQFVTLRPPRATTVGNVCRKRNATCSTGGRGLDDAIRDNRARNNAFRTCLCLIDNEARSSLPAESCDDLPPCELSRQLAVASGFKNAPKILEH